MALRSGRGVGGVVDTSPNLTKPNNNKQEEAQGEYMDEAAAVPFYITAAVVWTTHASGATWQAHTATGPQRSLTHRLL